MTFLLFNDSFILKLTRKPEFNISGENIWQNPTTLCIFVRVAGFKKQEKGKIFGLNLNRFKKTQDTRKKTNSHRELEKSLVH